MLVNVEFCALTLLLQGHLQMKLIILGLYDSLSAVDEAGEAFH